jgi:DNA topoisomerase-3
MRLFIAEKPSLARAIADGLPGPQTKRRDFIECGKEDVVAWCAGHILELAAPETYSPEYKAWRLEHLPIAPTAWRLTPTAPDLLRTIRSLLPRASRVVHAGDPDREGQLLVDEVLQYLGYRGPVDRLLISDLNPAAVREALADIRSNGRYRGLYEAALARQRADWLYGINLTRLYTVLGRAGGHDGVLSVGRVQTPLLGLIVRRDSEVDAFQPRTYFVVTAGVRWCAGTFMATWQAPPGATPSAVDAHGRLVSRDHAAAIKASVEGQQGTVVRCTRENRSEGPALPYCLPDLQMDAGRRLGLTPKQTLDVCQALYETHRLLTYPRSDCSYLPEGHFDQSAALLASVAANIPELAPIASTVDRSRRSRAWNDKKVTAHHAVIPTVGRTPAWNLSSVERRVYDLVARRYLAQFLPAFEFNETRVELEIAGQRFRSLGRQTLAEGWRRLSPTYVARDGEERNGEHAGPGDEQPIPLVRDGERVACMQATVSEKQTTPPKRFTEATLIEAMTGISRYVDDPKIKQLLKETDGIGTPATQADIIETLFDRHLIEKQGRHVVSTPVGRTLITVLPEIATRPDMTALWEAAMRRITDSQLSLAAFLDSVTRQLRDLIERGRASGGLKIPGARACAAAGCTGFLRRRQGPRGAFWSCTRYPDCKATVADDCSEPNRSRAGARRGPGKSRQRKPESVR